MTALLLGALSGGVVSAVVPFVNAELLLVGMTLTTSSSQWPLLVLAVATGQMIGKAVLFQTGGRMASAALAPRLARWGLDPGANRGTTSLVAASASLGLPPFYLVAVAAPSLGVRFRTFALVGLAGRIVRFAAVLLIPAAIAALEH